MPFDIFDVHAKPTPSPQDVCLAEMQKEYLALEVGDEFCDPISGAWGRVIAIVPPGNFTNSKDLLLVTHPDREMVYPVTDDPMIRHVYRGRDGDLRPMFSPERLGQFLSRRETL